MPSERSVPLSPYQRDIWLAAMRAPKSPQFNATIAEEFTGPVDIPLLRDCLIRTMERHDAFRLRFGEEDGVPRQWLADVLVADGRPAVDVIDFSSAPDPQAACLAWREKVLRTPIELGDGPLFRVALLRESDTAVHLLIQTHHLVADGRSMDLVHGEATEEYARRARGAAATNRAAANGRDAAPSALDAVTGRDDYFASSQHEADRGFHRAELAQMEPSFFARRHDPQAVPDFGRHTFTLPGDVAEHIKESGGSPFAFLAAALGTWLARVHRTSDAVLGMPLLNRRTRAELTTVAQYANTLPLRIEVPDGRPLADVAAQVQNSLTRLQEHQRLPYGEVLRELSAGTGGERRLYDVTLSFMSLKPLKPLAEGIERSGPLHFAPPHDQEALAVYTVSTRGTSDLRVILTYATDVFDEDLPVTSLADHLMSLIEHGLDKPERPAAELPLPAEQERERLQRFARGPQAAFAEDATLPSLFETRAALVPERPAVFPPDGQNALTYAELDARSARIAAALRARGVGPGDRVAVLMARGPHLLPAILGIQRAGGAYVPVDPGHPARRIGFVLADSGAKVVVTDAPLTGGTTLPVPQDVPVCPVQELLNGPDAPVQPATPAPSATARDLAYVIYTSGSTGQPKGVMVEHRSVVNRLAWMQRAYPIGAGDVLLQKTPVSFDVSVWELFWWAIEGAAVALLPPGGEKDPELMLRTVAERGVSVLHFVPSMLGPFLDLLEQDPERLSEARSLRYVFCSGEALPPGRVEQFNRVFAPAGDSAPRLVNLYGPTEAAVDVSVYECPAGPGRTVTRVPIGRPIDNTELYVIGPDGAPQPVGVPGELCIAGVQVARGYLNRPELTREKFTDDPWVLGGRLYRTGDLARWLADGTLEYLGRIDGQVKVRGNRVELGEVQDALARVPGVRDAAVTDHASDGRGTYLVGYYVTEDATDLDGVHLRGQLADQLPESMIPARFVRLDRLPLSPNGKLDRRLLPAPGAVDAETPGAAPRTPEERALAAVWAEVLGVERVGAHDNYYALGGDSLLMLRVRALAERQGLRFALDELMRHPTVAGLAAHVTRQGHRAGPGRTSAPAPEDDGTALPPFALVPDVDRARLQDAEDAFPMSRLQIGLVYHSRREEHSAVYHDVFRYRLATAWDEERFRHAFDRLTARHPVLRSSFDLGGFSEPLQIVHPSAPGGLDVADLRGSTPEAAEAAIGAHVEERRYHRYDFEQAPLYLFRAHVRDEAVELVFSFHHALLDGGSVANLLRELLQDYQHALGAAIGPVPDALPPGPAHHVREERAAQADPAAREHWRHTLEGAEVLRLDGFAPAETPRGDGHVVHHAVFPDDLAQEVRNLARQHALPVKSVLLAAHCLTLRLFSGLDEFTTGLITHGRPEREDAERMAGLFLNTLPVRVGDARTGAPGSWLEVVRELFRQEREAHAHRRYPLSAIQEDHGGTVLHTAFNYVHFHVLAQVLSLPGLRLESFTTWEETDFQLLVNAFTDPVDGRMGLRVDGGGQGITPSQAELFARTFTAVLHRIATRPEEAPDFAFLAEPDTALLAAPQGTASGPAATQDVVSLFGRQADRTPDAVAVSAHDGAWTYRELREMSERVARRLLVLGTRTGDRIGLATGRSRETIAAVLGIAKAGAACVPLDPSYPAARLAAMVEEARPARIIARETDAGLVPDPGLLLPAESLLDPPAESLPDPEDNRTAARELPAAIDPADGAYVLFTSGSTGRPKGVAMPHRSLAGLVGWQTRAASAAPGGKTAQYAPLSFDVSFQEIYSTLCSGGTLRLVTEDERRDMPALLRLLDREEVERVFLPYVALQQLAEASAALGLVPRRLRIIVSSGEQLRVTDEIRALLAALPGAVLENQYGPTESHVVTRHTMTGDPAAFPLLVPIGTPVEGTEVHVLDERGRPVPVGVKGELYLGGTVLADGYLGDPALTDERFVQMATPAGERRLYRTGDLALVLPDGALHYAGRADSQVKVRGYRVEPAEAELALTELAARHPEAHVREAAVVARKDAGGQTALVAFLVGDADRTDTRLLSTELRSALPDFMVPTHWEWLPALPLTPSGKRDDRALRALPLSRTGSSGGTPPRDAHERALVEMLADLLGTGPVGIHDDIFACGATSITVMRLVVLIEQRYKIAIPLSRFIAAPTVAALAELLRSGHAAAAFDPLVPIRTSGDRQPLFLTHPMGGNVLCYLPLSRHLPDDQPLYAFQAAGAEPGTEPLRTLPEIAASYIEAMRRVQPQGPYRVGGWSFGGFVAFEMARQLQAAGEEISQVVLLDTVAVGPGAQRGAYSDEALLGWFFWELLWLHRGGSSPMAVVPDELTTLDEKFSFIADLAAREGVLPADGADALVRRLFRVYAANWRATVEHRPAPTDQDIVLLRAVEPLPEVLRSMHGAAGTRYTDPANGWREVTTGVVHVVPVPGDHLTIMEEPHVADVARAIAELTDTVTAPSGPTRSTPKGH
ncbi:amino acid adenylation domain-containing protein [Streptomyces klenkii]|uniref:amino acid adenylation domain-containing protein n=1 Tax=Streptomyces klenkii TaxID=1420899 RepID=UPI0036E61A56